MIELLIIILLVCAAVSKQVQEIELELVCQPLSVATSGENVSLANLCDGNADCAAGDDETTPLCESEPHVIKHSLINCSYARVSYCTFCNR